MNKRKGKCIIVEGDLIRLAFQRLESIGHLTDAEEKLLRRLQRENKKREMYENKS